MGNHFQKVERIETISNMPAQMQMRHILSYWMRKHGLDMSNDILNLIIDCYTYQKVFDCIKDDAIKIREVYSSNLIFKVLLLGNCKVGKTSLLMGYCDSNIVEDNLYDYRSKIINIEDATIQLQIFDVVRTYKFQSWTKSYYDQSDAIVIVYDVTNKQTFECIPWWNEQINKYKRKENVVKCIIGNKSDLKNNRQVSTNESEQLCKKLDIQFFFETSAITGDNVQNAFESVARECYVMNKRMNGYPFY